MEDGHLVLGDLRRTRGDPATIDRFLRTLAMTHRDKAIGVILSGIGADGTAVLACIKGQGGVTIVQSPLDAEHSGMPQSAIDAGVASFDRPGIPGGENEQGADWMEGRIPPDERPRLRAAIERAINGRCEFELVSAGSMH